MTIEQTRLMSIEFERRLQTMFPAAKTIAKVDTEDIFSFLNQYQLLYVQLLYMAEDQAQSDTRASVLILDVLRTLTTHKRLLNIRFDDSVDVDNKMFYLPSDYYKYIRSTSVVSGTYKNHTNTSQVPNTLMKHSDIHEAIEAYYDDGRILRNPVVVLEGDCIKVIHDVYTKVHAVDLTYMRLPAHFTILTNTPCELPYECFEPMVSGALDLYIRHLQATLSNKQKQPKEERSEQ